MVFKLLTYGNELQLFRASYHFACQEGMCRDSSMLIRVENQPTLLVCPKPWFCSAHQWGGTKVRRQCDV